MLKSISALFGKLRMKWRRIFAFATLLILVLGGGYFWYVEARGEMYVVEKYRGFKSQVHKVWFGSNGEEISAISTLGVWDWKQSSGKLVRHLKIQYAKAVNEEAGVVLAAGPYSTLQNWDIVSKSRIHVWDRLDGGVGPILFLEDHRHFLVATGNNLIKGRPGVYRGTYDIELFDLETLQQVRTFHGHSAAASSLCLVPGTRYFLSASDDGTLRMWDIDSGQAVRMIGTPVEPEPIEGEGDRIRLRYSNPNDRPRVSSVSPDGKIAIWNSTLWDIRHWQEIKPLVSPHPQEKVLCSAFSPDGRRFITGHADGTVRLWSISTYGEICRVYGHVNGAPTLAVAFSPDGRYALTGGEGTIPGFNAMASGLKASDLVVRLWKLPELQEP